MACMKFTPNHTWTWSLFCYIRTIFHMIFTSGMHSVCSLCLCSWQQSLKSLSSSSSALMVTLAAGTHGACPCWLWFPREILTLLYITMPLFEGLACWQPVNGRTSPCIKEAIWKGTCRYHIVPRQCVIIKWHHLQNVLSKQNWLSKKGEAACLQPFLCTECSQATCL